MLVLSLGFAVADLVLILRWKLYTRVVMVYVAIAVGCEGLMALDSLFFTARFTETLGGKIVLTTAQPWLTLSQLQGFIFRAAELVPQFNMLDILCSYSGHDASDLLRSR